MIQDLGPVKDIGIQDTQQWIPNPPSEKDRLVKATIIGYILSGLVSKHGIDHFFRFSSEQKKYNVEGERLRRVFELTEEVVKGI